MLFVEYRFFIFFAIVAALYWYTPQDRYRKIILLVASYIFYGAWDWRFCTLIFYSTCLDYFAALKLESTPAGPARRKWLILSLISNLGILFFFKYFNFFADSLEQLAATLGFTVSQTTLNVILPAGISFYTFQSLSYTIDVYRDKIPARRSFLDFATFIAFFPQLVAGPIVRAIDFLPQFDRMRTAADVAVKHCLLLFLLGYIKKAVISDNLSPYVEMVFNDPSSYGWSGIVGGVLLYAVQIYCDFSGYSDMAIASAGLLGYQLVQNFDAPYLSNNITAFWRRWHMSLSTWLRDYLYIPLGGNRNGELMAYRNLMLTMVLGGLWHGAAWTFIIWGFLHGLALAFHKVWIKAGKTMPALRAIPPWLGVFLTFYWVCLAWIFFRAKDLASAMQVTKSFVLFHSPGTATLPTGVYIAFAFLAVAHYAIRRYDLLTRIERLPDTTFAALSGAAAAIAVSLVPLGYQPFIYFQF